jgi:hypothetical protein
VKAASNNPILLAIGGILENVDALTWMCRAYRHQSVYQVFDYNRIAFGI